jgi:hypothetical protein
MGFGCFLDLVSMATDAKVRSKRYGMSLRGNCLALLIAAGMPGTVFAQFPAGFFSAQLLLIINRLVIKQRGKIAHFLLTIAMPRPEIGLHVG